MDRIGSLSLSRRGLLRGIAAAAAAQMLPLPAEATPAPGSIGAVAAAHGIVAGCAVNGAGLRKDAEFRRLLVEQAAIVVPENAMKWRTLRPTPATFDYTAADRLMDFAARNGMLVRGHNLCWHLALPDWFAGTVTPENAAEILTDHIRNVAGHYAGRIQSWDVVNEAVNPSDGRPDGLRDSPWLRLLGPGYIDLAFRTTRAADPHALLVYNDYGIEAEEEKAARKRDAVLRLARSMRNRGVPIDAVGVQSHLWVDEKFGGGLRHFIRSAHKLGLQVYVTEMTVSDQHVEGSFAARDKAVAQVYGRYLDLVLSEGVRMVLTWGITDRYAYMSVVHPRADGTGARDLPFDQDLEPAKAFYAMIGAFERVKAAAPVRV